MSRIDELYLSRMEAESIEQDLWEKSRSNPHDFTLLKAHRDAVADAERAGAAYLDALIGAEAQARRGGLVAV